MDIIIGLFLQQALLGKLLSDPLLSFLPVLFAEHLLPAGPLLLNEAELHAFGSLFLLALYLGFPLLLFLCLEEGLLILRTLSHPYGIGKRCGNLRSRCALHGIPSFLSGKRTGRYAGSVPGTGKGFEHAIAGMILRKAGGCY